MLTPAQQTALRARLEADYARLTTVIQQLEDELRPRGEIAATPPPDAGEDWAARAIETAGREKPPTIEDIELTLLTQVRQALARLARGDYGRCLRCGREIPVERLEAIPYAAYCLSCEVAVERARPHGPRGEG